MAVSGSESDESRFDDAPGHARGAAKNDDRWFAQAVKVRNLAFAIARLKPASRRDSTDFESTDKMQGLNADYLTECEKLFALMTTMARSGELK